MFSGYLNNGPVFSVWPRVLSISATCTLKRLAYWSWDSTSPAASTLLSSWNTTNATGASGTPTTGNQTSIADGGLRAIGPPAEVVTPAMLSAIYRTAVLVEQTPSGHRVCVPAWEERPAPP